MRFILLFGLFATASLAQSQHEVVSGWPQLPEGHVLGLCAGVGVDAQNRVYVFHRSGRVWSKPFPKEPIGACSMVRLDGFSAAGGQTVSSCRMD